MSARKRSRVAVRGTGLHHRPRDRRERGVRRPRAQLPLRPAPRDRARGGPRDRHARGVDEHVVVDIDLRCSAARRSRPTSTSRRRATLDEMSDGIPVTYVPARNTIFLSFALAWAEVLGADDIFIGVNALDYSGYPDCRPEYIDGVRADGEPRDQARRRGPQLTIHTPLIDLTKAQIIERGLELGVDYSPDAQLL